MPLFGAQPMSYIANASPFPIKAKVDTYCNPEFNVNVPHFGSYSDNNRENQAGYCIIKPGKKMVFKPAVGLFDGSWFKRATVHISLSSMQGDKDVPICDNWKLTDNSSAIVTRDSDAVATKMGTIWTDTDGKTYK